MTRRFLFAYLVLGLILSLPALTGCGSGRPKYPEGLVVKKEYEKAVSRIEKKHVRVRKDKPIRIWQKLQITDDEMRRINGKLVDRDAISQEAVEFAAELVQTRTRGYMYLYGAFLAVGIAFLMVMAWRSLFRASTRQVSPDYAPSSTRTPAAAQVEDPTPPA